MLLVYVVYKFTTTNQAREWQVTTLCAISAAGNFVPLMHIFAHPSTESTSNTRGQTAATYLMMGVYPTPNLENCRKGASQKSFFISG